MHSTIMDPTVGTFAGFIVEPIDVLTMDIHIPMEDIIRTPMEDIRIPMGDIIVHPISGDGTNLLPAGSFPSPQQENPPRAPRRRGPFSRTRGEEGGGTCFRNPITREGSPPPPPY